MSTPAHTNTHACFLLPDMCVLSPSLSSTLSHPSYTVLKFVLGIDWSSNDTSNEDNAISKLRVMEPIEVVGNILITKLSKRIALDDESKGAKVVLVIEDIHWIDSSSLGVLQQLCHENLPLLLFATSRPSKRLDQVRVATRC